MVRSIRQRTGKSQRDSGLSDEFDVTVQLSRDVKLRSKQDLTSRLSGEDPGSGKPKAAPKRAAATAAPAKKPCGFVPGALVRDRYRIERVVYSGGMSRVYKAVDEQLPVASNPNRSVGIKTLRQAVVDQPEARNALEREAASLRHLAHPNIINVHDIDEDDGRLFLVMEWLEGSTVRDLITRSANGRLQQDDACKVIEGVTAGLRHSHANGVIHADVNPSNVFVTKSGDVKLIDFGVARPAAGLSRPHGDSNWAAKSFASPELIAGEAPAAADDVFSFACVVYLALSGSHPFGDVAADEAKARRLSPARIPGLSDEQWRFLVSALAFERSRRPRSVEGFLALAGRPERQAVAAKKTAAPEADAEPPSEISRWAWLAAGTAAAAVAWFAVTRPESPARVAPVETARPVATTEPAANEAQPGIEESADDTAAETATALDAEDSPTALSDAQRVDALLATATEALELDRLVEPADNSARDAFRSVLEIDPENADARNGLFTISDRFVADARTALDAGDAAAATAALSIATETFAGNPGIRDAMAALAVAADRQLDDAESAIAAGRLDEADRLLTGVRQFPAYDQARFETLDSRLDRERSIVGRVALANGHIDNGRLIEPIGGNAFDAVLSMRRDFPEDPRVASLSDQLANAMLQGASSATASGRFADAAAYLDTLDLLGVRDARFRAARESLAQAQRRAEATAESGDAVAEPVDAGQPAATSAGSPATAAPPATEPAIQGALKVDEGTAKVDYVAVSDLDMQRYIAPNYPRRAEMRNQAGYVDLRFRVLPDGSTADIEIIDASPEGVFESSAQTAVSRWEFAERAEPANSRVRLTFRLDF